MAPESGKTSWLGIVPNAEAVVRLVGTVLSEHNDEWRIARRYFSAESLAKLQPRPDLPELVSSVIKQRYVKLGSCLE